jgi:predicted nucleotide-binding protein (sugar kinase/HSP70/actin superfamily)
MKGHVIDTATCTRVMAGPDNIKAGFLKESDLFRENGIVYASPFVTLGDPPTASKELFDSLKEVFQLDWPETQKAVQAGYRALETFDQEMRQKIREVLQECARFSRPCLLVLARPYHMDPGIGHEIEVSLQAHGSPILWAQYFPLDEDLMSWLFGEEVQAGEIRHALDISDVWASSYSSNTNEILWGAKVAARCPWITCVIRLSSYECGMDQPTFTPAQKIVEASGTLFFKFGDLDATKPAGGINIRIETIVHYLERYSQEIIFKKLARLPGTAPFQNQNVKSRATQ